MSCKEHDAHEHASGYHKYDNDLERPLSPTRREALKRMVFGAGGVGLTALATGLPPAFILNPRAALAQTNSEYVPTGLIVATSGNGDSMNVNTPGSYEDPATIHPTTNGTTPVAGFEPTDIKLGTVTRTGAKIWNNVPEAFRNRMSFIHHATLTANHGDEPRVHKLMGAVRRDEMLISLIAKTLKPALGSIQAAPIGLDSEVIQFEGRYQPRLTPIGFRQVMKLPGEGLPRELLARRDVYLDKINAALKGSRSTTAQRAFLDRLALSQAQVRQLGEEFATQVNTITTNTADGQVIAAPLLLKMKVTPAVFIHMRFSDDNHADIDWAAEAGLTTATDANGRYGVSGGVELVKKLYANMTSAGIDIADSTTFAILNVFGRELRTGVQGRGHNSVHNVAVIAGPAVQGSVIGGTQGQSATNIDPTTGASVSSGGISLTDSLASLGKTLARACGVDNELINDEITQGQVIGAALTKGA